jgi:thiamine-phosphate pyrophosphorylase
MNFLLPRVYPITDQQLSGLSHADQVVLLAAAGASLIQLRDKESSAGQFLREANKALLVARELGVRIIINDRVDIALAVEADGVHLGQDDMPPSAARRILGDGAIIGFSTHNHEQAREATREPIDYIAAGPIFDTNTKTNPDPVLGLSGLREVRELIGQKPLVAIQIKSPTR